jgi:hypothetical protein
MAQLPQHTPGFGVINGLGRGFVGAPLGGAVAVTPHENALLIAARA